VGIGILDKGFNWDVIHFFEEITNLQFPCGIVNPAVTVVNSLIAVNCHCIFLVQLAQTHGVQALNRVQTLHLHGNPYYFLIIYYIIEV
jgi:hypothetical protein